MLWFRYFWNVLGSRWRLYKLLWLVSLISRVVIYYKWTHIQEALKSPLEIRHGSKIRTEPIPITTGVGIL